MKGQIFALDTLSVHDGPGARGVVFLQGCPLRCAYCHQPKSWSKTGGTRWEAQKLVEKMSQYQHFYNLNGGGITFSGGEPLYQPQFLLEMARHFRARGMHLAIETSGFGLEQAGFGYEMAQEILEVIDLVILDVKLPHDSHINQNSSFLRVLQNISKPLWIRYVAVPHLSDHRAYENAVILFSKKFKQVDRIEVLPYHELGRSQYEELGLAYPLGQLKDRI